MISFLNADDRLFNERSIEYIARLISGRDDGIDVYHGSVMVFDYEKGNGFVWKSGPISKDHEWTTRGLKKNGLRSQFMPILVTGFAKGGVSISKAHVPEAQAGTRRAVTTHFTPAEGAWQGWQKRVRREWRKLGRCLFP